MQVNHDEDDMPVDSGGHLTQPSTMGMPTPAGVPMALGEPASEEADEAHRAQVDAAGTQVHVQVQPVVVGGAQDVDAFANNIDPYELSSEEDFVDAYEVFPETPGQAVDEEIVADEPMADEAPDEADLNQGEAPGPDDHRGPKAKEGTSAWWSERRDDPITHAHATSVLQMCFWLGRLKHEYRISDIAIDMICRLIHFLILPAGNLFPPSFHLVKAVLGVPEGITSTRHVCDRCWTLFPPLEPDQFRIHIDATCNQCGNARFSVGFGGKPTPKRSVYYFGEAEVVTELLSKPGMIQAIRKHRQTSKNEAWTFMGSPAGRALDKACKFKFSNPGARELAIVFSLGKQAAASMCLHTSCHRHDIACGRKGQHANAGGDGAQIFLNKQHGSIIWGLKIHGMHPAFAAKNDTWIPLGVVQGPTEPKMMESILQSLLEFFMAHDPGDPSRPWCMHAFTRTHARPGRSICVSAVPVDV